MPRFVDVGGQTYEIDISGEFVTGVRVPPMHDDGSPLRTLRQIEADAIALAMRRCNGNKALVARVLGVDRRTLYRKLSRGAA